MCAPSAPSALICSPNQAYALLCTHTGSMCSAQMYMTIPEQLPGLSAAGLFSGVDNNIDSSLYCQFLTDQEKCFLNTFHTTLLTMLPTSRGARSSGGRSIRRRVAPTLIAPSPRRITRLSTQQATAASILASTQPSTPPTGMTTSSTSHSDETYVPSSADGLMGATGAPSSAASTGRPPPESEPTGRPTSNTTTTLSPNMGHPQNSSHDTLSFIPSLGSSAHRDTISQISPQPTDIPYSPSLATATSGSSVTHLGIARQQLDSAIQMVQPNRVLSPSGGASGGLLLNSTLHSGNSIGLSQTIIDLCTQPSSSPSIINRPTAGITNIAIQTPDPLLAYLSELTQPIMGSTQAESRQQLNSQVSFHTPVSTVTRHSTHSTPHQNPQVFIDLSDIGLSFATSTATSTIDDHDQSVVSTSTSRDCPDNVEQRYQKLQHKVSAEQTRIDRIHQQLSDVIQQMRTRIAQSLQSAIHFKSEQILHTFDLITQAHETRLNSLYDNFYNTIEDELRNNIIRPMLNPVDDTLRQVQQAAASLNYDFVRAKQNLEEFLNTQFDTWENNVELSHTRTRQVIDDHISQQLSQQRVDIQEQIKHVIHRELQTYLPTAIQQHITSDQIVMNAILSVVDSRNTSTMHQPQNEMPLDSNDLQRACTLIKTCLPLTHPHYDILINALHTLGSVPPSPPSRFARAAEILRQEAAAKLDQDRTKVTNDSTTRIPSRQETVHVDQPSTDQESVLLYNPYTKKHHTYVRAPSPPRVSVHSVNTSTPPTMTHNDVQATAPPLPLTRDRPLRDDTPTIPTSSSINPKTGIEIAMERCRNLHKYTIHKLGGDTKEAIENFYSSICLVCDCNNIPIMPLGAFTHGMTSVCPPHVSPDERNVYARALFHRLQDGKVIPDDCEVAYSILQACMISKRDGYYLLTQLMRQVREVFETTEPLAMDPIIQPTLSRCGNNIHKLAAKYSEFYMRQDEEMNRQGLLPTRTMAETKQILIYRIVQYLQELQQSDLYKPYANRMIDKMNLLGFAKPGNGEPIPEAFTLDGIAMSIRREMIADGHDNDSIRVHAATAQVDTNSTRRDSQRRGKPQGDNRRGYHTGTETKCEACNMAYHDTSQCKATLKHYFIDKWLSKNKQLMEHRAKVFTKLSGPMGKYIKSKMSGHNTSPRVATIAVDHPYDTQDVSEDTDFADKRLTQR